MRICHFSLWAPGISGLHQFVEDQVRCERKLGLDSMLINCDVENPDPVRFTVKEGDITCEPWSKALETEDCVWVLHRSIPNKLIHLLPKKKNLAILHGTSEIMVLHEVESNGKNDKFNMHVEFINTFKKVVCITKSDYDIMKLYDNGRNKVVYINDAVDTDRYSPDGPAWYYEYQPALISATNVRINKNPSFFIWAMPEIIKRIPRARLNLIGLNLNSIDIWKRIVLKSGPLGVAVENMHCQFRNQNLITAVRGASISLNSNYNGIFSRDSMEAMSIGLSVVAFTPEHTPYACYREINSIASAVERAWDDIKRNPQEQIEKNRAYALEHFSMQKITNQYVDLYNSLK